MRGRKPYTVEQLRLRGTYEPGKHGKRLRAPKAKGQLAEPPDWFTPSQAELWRYAIANAPPDVLTKLDHGLLVLWCESCDRHHTAMRLQSEQDEGSPHPLLVRGKEGTLIPSPLLRVMRQAGEIMIRCATELGFSPSARMRLIAPQPPQLPDPNSPWARLRLLQGGRAAERKEDEPSQSA